MATERYRVRWYAGDRSNLFAWRFDTREEAHQYGRDWRDHARKQRPEDGPYRFDVVTVVDK